VTPVTRTRSALATGILLLLAVGAWARPVAPAAPPGSDPDVAAEAPMESVEDLRAYLADCAARLGPADRGLARVTRICPGIDYRVLHGPIAPALHSNSWARYVNAAALRALATVAATYQAGNPRVLDPRTLAPVLERAQLGQRDSRSWLRRQLERIAAWFEGNPDRPDANSWLARLLKRILGEMPSARLVNEVVVWVLVCLAALLTLYGLRRSGVWARALKSVDSLRAREPVALATPGERYATDLSLRVSERFAARIAELELTGVLRGGHALSCREVARRLESIAGLERVARAAPVVERLAYAAVPPPEAELLAVDADLAGTGNPR